MPSLRSAFFNFFNSQARVRQFSPSELEDIFQQYRDNIGLSQSVDFGAGAFDTHVGARVQDHTGFKTPIGPEKEDTLEKMLKGDEPDKKAAREAFKTLLAPQEFFTSAQKRYKESMEVFKEQLKDIPANPNITVEYLIDQLVHINAQARDALKAQQKEELRIFKDKAPELAKKVGVALGYDLTADADKIQKIQENLIKDLETSHSEQLTAFNKSSEENMKILIDAATVERRQIIFTGQLEKTRMQLSASQKDEMLTEMERAREENRKKRGVISPEEFLEGSIDVAENTISAVNPEDLRFIISLTGAKISHTPGVDAEHGGAWQVKMTPRILSPLYYLSNRQNPKVDILTMAQAVRASGFDAITLTINFDDPKTQKARARQAYEAALETGFDPSPLPGEEGKENPKKGINLKDGSGKPININTLFSEKELEEMHKKAAKTREHLKKLVEQPAAPKNLSEQKTSAFRDTLADGRIKAGKVVDKTKEEEHDTKVQDILKAT